MQVGQLSRPDNAGNMRVSILLVPVCKKDEERLKEICKEFGSAYEGI